MGSRFEIWNIEECGKRADDVLKVLHFMIDIV